jgi:hypothetical protein
LIVALKEPKGRIARWLEILSAFDFSVEYRAGPKHGNARNAKRGLRTCLAQCPFLYLLLKTYYKNIVDRGIKQYFINQSILLSKAVLQKI